MLRLSLIAAAALAFAAAAIAQPAQLTRDQANAAVQEVIRLVEAHYVFPEKRAVIAGALKSAHAAGRYNVATPQELAERVSEDLTKASHDGHLSLSFDPDRYQEIQRPRRGPEASPSRDNGRRQNDGYEEQKVLPGNVRYIRVTGFLWFDESTPRIVDAAARFLADGDAIVVDLRGNGGGHAQAVQRLISYFFPRGGQELIRFHDGLSGETSVNRVLDDLPSPRLAGKPVYTLIDGGVGSAAEEFAYHIQQFKLGTLVGRTTAGAANNNQLYPVAPFFVASISVGRPEHPVSRTNWEGKGIAPHVETPPPAALDHAHMLALQTLAARADPRRRRDYEWDIAGLQAKVKPLVLPPAALDAYVGTYGIRRVWREGTTLMFQREQREPTVMTPMGNDLFGLGNSSFVRVQFRRNGGRVVGFDQVTKDGIVSSSERTG
jgi:hypothetical protein